LELSRLYNIPCFNKDLIKEVLGCGFGQDGGLVLEKGSSATFLLMMHITEKLIKTGSQLILESNFKLHEMEQIQVLLDKYNYSCLSFIFKGDFNVLFERYMKRDNAGARHWVHDTSGENSENFAQDHIKEGIGKMGIGKTIITDVTSFSDVNYNELYSAAGAFLQTESCE